MRDYPTVNIGGAAIEVLRVGDDAWKPTIVMLHEGLGCVALWRDIPELLHTETAYNVVAYSRLGYGGSDPTELPRPVDHMRIEGEEFLPRLFAALEIDKPILFGHSDGATIALEFAGARPNDLTALVLLAPHVFVEELSLISIRAINEQYSEGGLREKLARYHGDNVDCAFRGWCDTWLSPRFASWNMVSKLASIGVPVIQFQGTADEYGTRVHVDAIERSVRGPCLTRLIADCGHAPHLEHKQLVLTEVAEFIRRLAR